MFAFPWAPHLGINAFGSERGAGTKPANAVNELPCANTTGPGERARPPAARLGLQLRQATGQFIKFRRQPPRPRDASLSRRRSRVRVPSLPSCLPCKSAVFASDLSINHAWIFRHSARVPERRRWRRLHLDVAPIHVRERFRYCRSRRRSSVQVGFPLVDQLGVEAPGRARL
jgi:hypothetical protein